MTGQVTAHVRRLRYGIATGASGMLALSSLVYLFDAPVRFRLVQAAAVVWLFVGVGVLNLVTVMPAHRAMLERPRRVYAVDHDVPALLHAHSVAHAVAVLRVLGLALLGLLLFLFTGERGWFWLFAAVGLAGCALLWPLEARIRQLVQVE